MPNSRYTPATAQVDMAAPDAVEQILAIHRGLFGGYRMEDDDNDQAGGGDGAGDNAAGDRGFPAETPVQDMTAEQQAAYWKYQSRKHERRANAVADYDAIKAERDQLRQASMTPDERALDDARIQAAEQARAEERGKWASQLVKAEVRGALSARQVPADRVAALLGPLDTNYFLTESGEVDADKVTQYAEGFGPASSQWPDTGQGKRGGAAPAKGVDAGRDLFHDRSKKK